MLFSVPSLDKSWHFQAFEKSVTKPCSDDVVPNEYGNFWTRNAKSY